MQSSRLASARVVQPLDRLTALHRGEADVVLHGEVERYATCAGRAIRHRIEEALMHHGTPDQHIVERPRGAQEGDDIGHVGTRAILGAQYADQLVLNLAHRLDRDSRTATLFCTARRLSTGSTGCSCIVVMAAAWSAAKIDEAGKVGVTRPPVA